MQESYVVERIKALCKARSWTHYRLAKKSGITYSTLNTMLNKYHTPTIPTLSRICDGFGISLAQFFSEQDESVLYSSEQKKHLALWDKLTPAGKQMADSYIEGLLDMQNRATSDRNI